MTVIGRPCFAPGLIARSIARRPNLLLGNAAPIQYTIKKRISQIPAPETTGISWFQKHLDSAQHYYSNSVRPSTQKTYSTGERRWFVVAEHIGTDPLMRMIPQSWVSRTDKFQRSTLSWPESCMLAFLASCRDAGQMVTPCTAFLYLSAVRKFLENNGIDVKFFDGSQYIKNTKAGMVNTYRAEMNKDVQDPQRLPISIDMIIGQDRKLRCSKDYGLAQLAVHTAQLLAYSTLSRVSEYLLTPGEAEHLLVSECVLFEMGSGDLVPSCDIIDLNFSDLKGCVIDILSAKNDMQHKGNRMHFGLADTADANQVYCITTKLWEYARASRPVRGKSFFFIPVIQWTLKPPYFNTCLKQLAIAYGLDPERVSSHSLRIGGASALAAAGLPDYVIMDMGRWRSLAFLLYIRKSTEMFEVARTALARGDLLSADRTRFLNPRSTHAPIKGL